ncbi:MAG: response regulator [Planctomycetaceae bacterium]
MATVESALTASMPSHFDLAICDLQLPDGDGVALLRRLQHMNSDLFGLIITA